MNIIEAYYKDNVLNSPNLQILYLNEFYRSFTDQNSDEKDEVLLIDTPKLSILKFGNYFANAGSFKILNPLSIMHLFLETDNFHNLIEEFKNLEYLTIYGVNYDSNRFLQLVRLKEIHLLIHENCYPNEFDSMYESIDLAIALHDEKQKLRRDNLSIFIFGLQLEKLKQFDQLEQFLNDVKTSRFIARFYSQFNNLNWVKEINFTGFSSFFENNLSNDLAIRLPNLVKVIVTDKIENIDFFFDFISKSRLEQLDLTSAFEDQATYNRLSALQTITCLKFKSDLAINLDFSLKYECKSFVAQLKLEQLS